MIQGTFSSKLKAMLKITTINMNIFLLELGCESFLAVEIRTWFLKELHVEIPTFNIVAGSTAAEICRDAARRYFALKPAKIEEDSAAVKADEEISTREHSSVASSITDGDDNDSLQTSENESSINTVDITPASAIDSVQNESLSSLDAKLES